MIEVEKKAYLKSPHTVEKIKEIADYKGESFKDDIYFAPIGTTRINVYKDPIFRIRTEKSQKILSYKKKSIVDKTEVNIENEIDITNMEVPKLRSFFQYLGFYPFIEKKKITRLYNYSGRKDISVNIEHNTVENLGDFIEVEILTEKEEHVPTAKKVIDDLFTKLEIKEDDIESKYYIDLLMELNR